MRKPVRIGITGVIANATYSDNPSPELEQLVTRIAEKAYEQTSEPMKTKYIKVEKNYQDKLICLQPVMLLNPAEGETISDSFWAKEVPDHSEEMLSLLEEIIIHSKIDESHDYNLINKAKQLINKVKDNG